MKLEMTHHALKNWMIPSASFARSNDFPMILHLYTFGCPTYVLIKELPAKKKIDKWRSRCRVGPSPSHESSLHINMSPITMQAEMALSTTQAKFIALSKGLKTAIPVMNLIEELREEKIGLTGAKAIAMVPN